MSKGMLGRTVECLCVYIWWSNRTVGSLVSRYTGFILSAIKLIRVIKSYPFWLLSLSLPYPTRWLGRATHLLFPGLPIKQLGGGKWDKLQGECEWCHSIHPLINVRRLLCLLGHFQIPIHWAYNQGELWKKTRTVVIWNLAHSHPKAPFCLKSKKAFFSLQLFIKQGVITSYQYKQRNMGYYRLT